MQSDFISSTDISDILAFTNELTMTYEEREKQQRKAADEALANLDIIKELEKQNNTKINLEDWDF